MGFSTPSVNQMIAFGVSVLIIGLGVAFAPEIKNAVMGLKRKARV